MECSSVPTVLLSVIVPVHNEEEVLRLTYQRLTKALELLNAEGLGHELVFINDGSRDASAEILDELASTDRRVSVVHLARNFGHQPAVTAGLTFARGDVVAIIDADLQDPPELLPQMLERWRAGYQVVYAVRQNRKEGMLKRIGYWTFYRLFRAISELEMPLDSGDFCVLDRSAVNLLNSLPERQRFVRGLRTWIGLRQIGIGYERNARAAGNSSYNLYALVKLAMDGLVSFSTLPLRTVTLMGLCSMMLAVVIGLWVVGVTIYESIYGGDSPRGWASLACVITFFASVQLLSLGIIGEYLAKIFLEVKGRPTYLVGRIVPSERSQVPKRDALGRASSE